MPIPVKVSAFLLLEIKAIQKLAGRIEVFKKNAIEMALILSGNVFIIDEL